MKQPFHNCKPSFQNEHEAIQWKVILSFVSADQSNGYQREETAHDCTREEAIVEAISKHLDESYPLAGICVYQCVYLA